MRTPQTWVGRWAALALVLVPLAGQLATSSAAEATEGTETERSENSWLFNRLRGDASDEGKRGDAPSAQPTAPEKPVGPKTVAAYDLKDLQDPLDMIRRSVLSKDPAVMSYVERIERGNATATELNDFASFLLRRGVPNIAAPFQTVATEMEPDKPSLWVNLGTIEQARERRGAARSAYKKAIGLDPTNGLAYYGLGVVADSEGHYDEAIEFYRRALLIDPNLADPKVNPQVVNNDRMLVVQLLLSKDRAGAMSLPLLPAEAESPSSGQ